MASHVQRGLIAETAVPFLIEQRGSDSGGLARARRRDKHRCALPAQGSEQVWQHRLNWQVSRHPSPLPQALPDAKSVSDFH